MNLFSIGISHHTASVEVREKMWLSEAEAREILPRLREQYFSECMLVSTCNRTELYGMILPGTTVTERELTEFLIGFKKADPEVQPQHFTACEAGAAVHQIFRVAAGTDSMVLGDIQILNQVKEAFGLAREVGATGPVMNRLMQATLHVGKRVRSETGICEGAVSVSYAAVELASKIFSDLSKKSALLIGAGETGELTLKHLVGKGIGGVRIANRTREKAETLAAAFSGTVVDYDSIADTVAAVDIVITSVTGPTFVLGPEELHRVMRKRANAPLFIIDIGVPRNVDPASRKIENVFLYDIDSLNTVIDRNLDRRKAEIPKVTAILHEETEDFFDWYNSLQVTPTIKDLRDAFENIRTQEVQKNIQRFRAEDRELLDIVTKQIVNKLLHQPMTVLRAGSASNNGRDETLLRVHTVRELFGIGRRVKGADDGA